MGDFTLADNILGVGTETEQWLLDSLPTIGWVLLAALSVIGAFVAYKVIKRALNKA